LEQNFPPLSPKHSFLDHEIWERFLYFVVKPPNLQQIESFGSQRIQTMPTRQPQKQATPTLPEYPQDDELVIAFSFLGRTYTCG